MVDLYNITHALRTDGSFSGYTILHRIAPPDTVGDWVFSLDWTSLQYGMEHGVVFPSLEDAAVEIGLHASVSRKRKPGTIVLQSSLDLLNDVHQDHIRERSLTPPEKNTLVDCLLRLPDLLKV